MANNENKFLCSILNKSKKRNFDSRWRANLALCFENLLNIIPISKDKVKKFSKANIIDIADRYITYLEKTYFILLLAKIKKECKENGKDFFINSLYESKRNFIQIQILKPHGSHCKSFYQSLSETDLSLQTFPPFSPNGTQMFLDSINDKIKYIFRDNNKSIKYNLIFDETSKKEKFSSSPFTNLTTISKDFLNSRDEMVVKKYSTKNSNGCSYSCQNLFDESDDFKDEGFCCSSMETTPCGDYSNLLNFMRPLRKKYKKSSKENKNCRKSLLSQFSGVED